MSAIAPLVDDERGDMAREPRRDFDWRQRTAVRVAGVSAGTSPTTAVALVVGLIGASWAVAFTLGGAGPVPPHWFYIPIMFAALRFGWPGTLLTSAVSGLAAGPMLPLEVGAGTPQAFSDWGMRAAFFVGIGQALALLVHQPPALRLGALRLAHIDRAVRRALANGELEVHYQPIVDIHGQRQRVVGAEALVRWRHPKRGLIPPMEFIPAAEETDLISDIGDFVLRDACSRIMHWSDLSGDQRFEVSVNLSARELADPTLVPRVARAVRDHRIEPRRLTLEITETAAMEDMDLCLKQLAGLRAQGINLAIDDFGTGRASLAYVQLFPVQRIKLDRSFTAQLTESERGRVLVGTLILLAHTLDFTAVAEGIECAEQLELLRAMGCDLGQGFHLGIPSPPDQITEAFDEQRSKRARRLLTEEHPHLVT
jgi:EAL domain-containing protein (putative c-di-GMP-specific phosphodiesterase class I)